MLTLGSLFDGIGGWCLAAQHNGVKPVWSSEIEKFPLAVTRIRFPDVKQLGDITQIDGGKIEPVDIICAGSPCQDLSIANGSGRKGLDGERSGLFAESVRIVRQMQRATGGRYPAFYCWENVPGAYSSNAGNDFRTVLGLLAEAHIPNPTGGMWADAGMVERNGCQIAWRTINAEFYGVPQRRRRIFLICDFRGYRAAETLFIENGVFRDSKTGEKRKQNIAGGVNESAKGTSKIVCDITQRRDVIRIYDKGIVPTLNALMGTGGNNVPLIFDPCEPIRRFTVREIERLQGLPDDYTLIDDKSCSSSARLKALGNGMAQPCADWIIKRIVEVTKEDEKC